MAYRVLQRKICVSVIESAVYKSSPHFEGIVGIGSFEIWEALFQDVVKLEKRFIRNAG